MSKHITRRMFLTTGAGVLTASVLAACGATPTPTPAPTATKPPAAPTAAPTATKPPAAPTATKPAAAPTVAPTVAPTAAPASKFKEAPALADLVKQGKLPAVDARLPKEPLVITPNEKVGTYGGQWRSTMLGMGDVWWLRRTMGYEPLVRWDLMWTKPIPNIAKKWEVSPDGKEFTFYLREGMKWSDGEPFTADDYVFWYEDIVLNPDLAKVSPPPAWLKVGGELGKVVKVNDYAFKFVFVKPSGLLITNLATWNGVTWVQAKYAKQFHTKYNKDAVAKMVTDGKFADWAALFLAKTWGDAANESLWTNADRPTLLAWKPVAGLGAGTRFVTTRNPYYWKVDTAGNQLPYLDQTVYDIVESADVTILKAINGEIDFQDRNIATNANKPVFLDNRAKGNYRLTQVVWSTTNEVIIYFNFNHKDPVLRDIFRKKDFRIAMSHALNRKEIIDIVFVGQGEVAQEAPMDGTIFEHKRLKTQYTEYDVAKANKLLDGIGLDKKGPDGIRLRPDGKPLSLVVEIAKTAWEKQWVDSMELARKQWKVVGVDLSVKVEDRTLFETRRNAMEHDVMVWRSDAGPTNVLLGVDDFLPLSASCHYARAWADWYMSGGTKGEEPPAATKKQFALWNELQTTTDEKKQRDLVMQVLDIAADEFYSVGIVNPVPNYAIVKNNFRNVPAMMFASGPVHPNPGPSAPEQFFLEN